MLHHCKEKKYQAANLDPFNILQKIQRFWFLWEKKNLRRRKKAIFKGHRFALKSDSNHHNMSGSLPPGGGGGGGLGGGGDRHSPPIKFDPFANSSASPPALTTEESQCLRLENCNRMISVRFWAFDFCKRFSRKALKVFWCDGHRLHLIIWYVRQLAGVTDVFHLCFFAGQSITTTPQPSRRWTSLMKVKNCVTRFGMIWLICDQIWKLWPDLE